MKGSDTRRNVTIKQVELAGESPRRAVHPDNGPSDPISDSAGGRPAIRTIGHGTRTTDELTALLSSAGVATLIDVRRYPTGQRQPHLSRERLAADLPECGVAYEWWGEALGGRRSATEATVADSGWRSPAFAAYSAHMSTPVFRAAQAELEERASAGEPLAIMCAETVWWRCHRRLIADALTLDGFVVEHVIDRVPGRPHRLSEPSRK
jgi:uncharacterized protein (DUF488 family)